MATDGEPIVEVQKPIDLTPQFSSLEKKGIGRVVKNLEGKTVALLLFPKLESGLPPAIFDAAITGTKGETVILQLESLLARDRTKLEELIKEGKTLSLKNGKDISGIISELQDNNGLIPKGNSTETGNEKTADSARDYRDKLLDEAYERYATKEIVPKLRKKSADSLISKLNSYFPDEFPSSPITQIPNSSLSSGISQGPANNGGAAFPAI